MTACRICLGAISDEGAYHPACVESLFGVKTLPRLDISLPSLMRLATDMADLLCTRLPIPSDRSLALSICGKKSNLSRRTWLDFAEYCQIPERAALRLLSEQMDVLEPSVAIIRRSFLPEDQKTEYEAILRENVDILSRNE